MDPEKLSRTSTAAQSPEAELADKLRETFRTGKTKTYEWRIKQLQALKAMLLENEEAWTDALNLDVKRTRIESKAELVLVLRDINESLKSLRSWMKPERLPSPALVWPCNTESRFDPLGVVLILPAFNAPLYTLLKPLVSAISAGNCAMMKASEKCKRCESLLLQHVPAYMQQDCFCLVAGGAEMGAKLLEVKWDFICFTGSQRVAKIVMKAAAEHLTPTCIELGGKNPVIVDENAGDLKTLAKRVISGMGLNAGQICVGPDYVVCLEGEAEKFERACVEVIEEFWGKDPLQSVSLARIIDQPTTEKIQGWLNKSKGQLICGGQVDVKECFVSPTLIANEPLDSELMTNETFAPILCFYKVSGNAPLALYVMSRSSDFQQKCIDAIPSGGACVNDTVWHLFCGGFGGVGSSGHGKLTGRDGFHAFSNKRTVVRKRLNFFDLPVRFAPFSAFDAAFVRALGPALPDIPPLPRPPSQLASFGVMLLGGLAAALHLTDKWSMVA